MPRFSPNEILNYIDRYSKTGAGKAAIKKVIKNRNFVCQWADDNTWLDDEGMAMAAADMEEILYTHIKYGTQTIGAGADGGIYTRLGLFYFDRNDISSTEPKAYGKNQMVINVQFDEAALRRPSLLGGDEQINDIVSLFVHGYHASHSVSGEWHGRHTVSLTWREYNHFMQDAVEEFNSKHSRNAIARLAPDYY